MISEGKNGDDGRHRLGYRLNSTVLPASAFILCLVGIYVTWMLSLSYLLRLELPCGDSEDCVRVALSPAARVGPVPLPLFGIGYYFLVACLSCLLLFRLAPVARYLYPISLVGAIVSVSYALYGSVILHASCRWCIASCVTACLLAGLYSFQPSTTPTDRSGRHVAALVFALVALLAVAMGVSAYDLKRSAERFPYDPAALAAASRRDMIPGDALTINPQSRGPVVVMFIDLECGSCQATFNLAFPKLASRGTRVIVRNLPHAEHPGAFDLAVALEEASGQNQGLPFLRRVFSSNSSNLDGEAVLKALGVRETSTALDAAEYRVRRDQSLALQLGLTKTPSIFIVGEGLRVEAISRQELLRRLDSSGPLTG